jgi:hypothetical protein
LCKVGGWYSILPMFFLSVVRETRGDSQNNLY